jgi:hypothetical protein
MNSRSNKSKYMQSALAANRDRKRDEASWATLDNFTPSNIKRTASVIMREWEKSLMPLPEERRDPPCGASISRKMVLQEQESRLLLNNLP